MFGLAHPDYQGKYLALMDVVKSSYSFNYLEDGIMEFPDAMKAYMFIDVAKELVERMSSWKKAHKDEWLILIEGLEAVEYDGFVDLGLPSGTKWKRINEDENDCFTFDDAVKFFGEALPTREDFQELIDNCKSEWDDVRKGSVFTGPNGNSIFLPAMGFKGRKGSTVYGRGSLGYYWSSSIIDEEYAYSLCFNSYGVDTGDYYYRSYGYSVRLVQK